MDIEGANANYGDTSTDTDGIPLRVYRETSDKKIAPGHDEKDGNQGEKEVEQVVQSEHKENQGHELYSVFTVNQKQAMIATGSLASFFSPLSSSIYFPALGTIARELNVSVTKIDLTVTTYLVGFFFSFFPFSLVFFQEYMKMFIYT